MDRELDRRVDEALDAVDMAHAATGPPHHLSFGERRRVAIATVLAMEPDVLVLDEPSSNLDPAARREVADILDGLALRRSSSRTTCPYALELCDRAVILDDGAIVADGPTGEVLADDELLAAHRLELPYGFDPATTSGPAPGWVARERGQVTMTTAEFTTRVESGQLVLTVRGEVDIANIEAFASALTALTAQADGHRLVVDASGLTYLDSMGIKALMRAQRRYDHGSRIALRNATPTVRRVLELTVPDMFDLIDTD